MKNMKRGIKMVSSMLSMVMVVALLLGNFTLEPTSSWQMKSGELKFKVETRLNKPLDEKLTGNGQHNLR